MSPLPTVALVHGNPETAAIWSLLVDAVAELVPNRIVTLSPPGFGAPTPPGWDASRTSYRDWLVGALVDLAVTDGPLHLVGHDWGAGHVFGVLEHLAAGAVTIPAGPHASEPLLATWTTDCAGLLHPDYTWHDAAQGWQTPEVGEAMVAAMTGMPHADRAAFLQSIGMTAAIADDVAAALDDEMGRCVLALYRSAAQPALSDLGARLGGLLPSGSAGRGLVVIADQDPYAGTVAMMDDVARRLDATTARLDGHGHWWMISAPHDAAAALAAHWQG